MPDNQSSVFKIGLAIIENHRLLLVRRAKSPILILPGGKPECDETEIETLQREANEELSCSIGEPQFIGSFSDISADDQNKIVIINLYSGTLLGTPLPSSEIIELVWATATKAASLVIAPSIKNKIIPFLVNQKLL